MMSVGRVACVGLYQNCVDALDAQLIFVAQNQSVQNLTKLDAPKSQASGENKEPLSGNTVENSTSSEAIKSNNMTDNHKKQSRVGEVKRNTFLNYSRAMPGGILTGIFMVCSCYQSQIYSVFLV
jgi:hypothetical protein